MVPVSNNTSYDTNIGYSGFALVSCGYLSAVLMVLLHHDRKAPARVRGRKS